MDGWIKAGKHKKVLAMTEITTALLQYLNDSTTNLYYCIPLLLILTKYVGRLKF